MHPSDPNQPQPHRPRTDRILPGQTLAVIADVDTRERGFIFARGLGPPHDRYFVHSSSVPADLWSMLEEGDVISCRVRLASKGARAFDVRAATAAEKASVQPVLEREEESRGNR